MPTTITTYNTFVKDTKARATEANNNFSNHRGTLVPINTDTASASDGVHDNGTAEHRWRVGYYGTLNLEGSTSTVNPIFDPDTSVTTGAMDLLFGTSTIGSWISSGLLRKSLAPISPTTSGSDAGIKGVSFVNMTAVNIPMNTSTQITMASIRMSVKGGGIIEVGCVAQGTGGELVLNGGTASGAFLSGSMHVRAGDTTTSFTTIASVSFLSDNVSSSTITASWPISSIKCFDDFSTITTERVYELLIKGSTSNDNSATADLIGRFYAREY